MSEDLDQTPEYIPEHTPNHGDNDETVQAPAAKSSDSADKTDIVHNDEMIEQYRIEQRLGKGGMALVYLAQDTALERSVAIKFLHSHLEDRNDVRERFIREAKSAAKISHANVVAIHAIGQHHEHPYMVLEYIDGQDIDQILKEHGPYADKEAAEIIKQCCDGLQELHHNHIVHRDIKPHNIFLTKNGVAKLGDLGIARSLDEDQELTSTGEILGTPAYISPEQVNNNDAVDIRSDIHALGGTLFTLLTGKRPFNGDSLYALCDQVVKGQRPTLQDFVADADPALNEIIHKAMHPDPDKRYQEPQEMAQALGDFLSSNTPATAAIAAANNEQRVEKTSVVSQRRDSRKRPLSYFAIIAIILLIGIGSLFSNTTLYSNKDRALIYGEDSAGPWLDMRIHHTQQRFRLIPADTYSIGSPSEEAFRSSNEMKHQVALSTHIWIAEHECTNELWNAIFKTDSASNAREPVHSQSWNEIDNFLSSLSQQFSSACTMRLPTEAEWEVACRAQTSSAYCFGDNAEYLQKYANFADESSKLEWAASNGGNDRHPQLAAIKQFLPNAWGIYDMHGNVREWCADSYKSKLGSSLRRDPYLKKGNKKVIRGGSWKENPENCRSARRTGSEQHMKADDLGFRFVLILEASIAEKIK